MIRNLKIEDLDCLCATGGNQEKIAYVLYPLDVLSGWIEDMAKTYDATIVVITGMDWDNVFSPWPSAGEPPGSPDFQGKSPEFLEKLQQKVIPQIEQQLGFKAAPERTLFGVSMSGLFALWQWMVCNTFHNIASLSGSFWYPGFLEWMKDRTVPKKSGKGYFLLGNLESKSPVKAFETVGVNTAEIISLLKNADITVEFQSVPGNHFADPIPRLDKAFAGIYK